MKSLNLHNHFPVMPKVSVVIPLYNAQNTIERAIDSVLKQTFTDWEIIIVDDGSEDRSGTIADEFAQKYDNIKSLHQANAGQAEARRHGFSVATGEYVTGLDSDDTLPSDALDFMVTMAEQHNLDAVFTGSYRVIDGRVKLDTQRAQEGVFAPQQLVTPMLSGNFPYIGAQTFSRRELWNNPKMFPPSTQRLPREDVYTTLKMTLVAKRIGVYNKPCYNYFFYPTSSSMAGTLHTLSHYCTLSELVAQALKDAGIYEPHIDDLYKMALDFVGFQVKYYDPTDERIMQMMSWPTQGFPLKHKVMQHLLPYPALKRKVVAANAWLKKIINH